MSWPAPRAYGPSWPQPVIRPNTSFGLRARHSSGPMPRRSITPGRNPSMSASACGDEVEQRGHAVGVLEVDGHVAPAAQRGCRRGGVAGRRAAHGLGPLDAEHLGAHVGQHHGGERAGADAGDLDDPVAGQRSGHGRQTSPTDGADRCGRVTASTIVGHSGSRQVVAHVAEQQQVGVGDRRRRGLPPLGRDQRVVATVDARASAPARRRALRRDRRWRRSRRAGAARPPGRRRGRRRRPPAPRSHSQVDVALRGPDGAAVGGGDERLPLGRRRRSSRTSSASVVGAPTRGSPGELMIDVRLRHRLRVLDGHRLGDHPAHRRAHDVRPLDAEVVEQPDARRWPCPTGVRHRRRRLAGQDGLHDAPSGRRAGRRAASTARSRGCRSG